MDLHIAGDGENVVSLQLQEQPPQQAVAVSSSSSDVEHVRTWEPDAAERIRLESNLVVGMGVAESSDDQQQQQRRRPFMVALVGPPGSGKSASSFVLANLLDRDGLSTMVMPHDGYHYPLEMLRSFPDAEDAIYRRGAPDTFDPGALLRDLRRIRDGEEDLITVPAFDHARGDPEADVHAFDRNRHRVVVCEGLYLLHDDDGWEEIASLFDLTIFMHSDVDDCIERVKIRNQCIPGYTPEEIAVRCEEVDRVNAMTVMQSRDRADLVVDSAMGRGQVSQLQHQHRQYDEPVNGIGGSGGTTSMKKSLSSLSLKDTDLVAVEADAGGLDGGISVGMGMNLSHHQHHHHPVGMVEPLHPTPRHRSVNPILATERPKDRDDAYDDEAGERPPEPASTLVGSWEPAAAERIRGRVPEVVAGAAGPGRPFMVALVGIPGSGKSVSSFLLATLLDNHGLGTMVMPHDGYHYPLEYLKTFPDADDAIYRRGAPDTFDPGALLRDLRRIRDGEEELITVPAFDHARADPEPDTHAFDRNRHRVVLCEGLYLLHDDDGWEDVASMFDLAIFMNANVDLCVERVKIRNQCIPGYTPEEIEERCERVDRVNAMMVMRSKRRADIVVDSAAA